ncbi:aminotransferase [Tabrizicola sp.]|uniref:aminotransferase n=1 Tax=Tabrizicola sp. TaxID=2005166 RepID=UPI002FDEF7B1
MTNTPASNRLRQDDIDHVIHLGTNLKTHAEEGPFIVAGGEGVWLIDEAGNRYIEALSGLWCASLGFTVPRLRDAAARAIDRLPYSHLFFSRSHEAAIQLADRLIELAPEGLSRVLFSNSGSEANDAAVKLVWYYNNARGLHRKKKVIGRMGGYHGTTLASSSLTGIPNMHRQYDLPLSFARHTDSPHYWKYAQEGESEEAFARRLAGNLESLIEREGPHTIGAFIAEPVIGSGGVILPPKGYFDLIQPILRKHDILFIADEIICGFGRAGSWWGSDVYGIRPDILTCGKQLAAGVQPISATLVSEEIAGVMARQSDEIGAFWHGVTHAGHPVCAAVALETLKIYEEEDVMGHAARVGRHLQARLAGFADHPLVGEVRGIGMMGALQLVSDKATKTGFLPRHAIGSDVRKEALRHGLALREAGDAVVLSPPLIITEAEIDNLCDRLRATLDVIQTTRPF